MSEPLTIPYPITDPLQAAAYAATVFRGRAPALRSIAAAAGKVMTVPLVKLEEVLAAWAYKQVDEASTVEEQASLIVKLTEVYGGQVGAIVHSMAVPPNSKPEVLQDTFVKSSTSAKMIRVCETIIGISEIYREIAAGSPSRLQETQAMLQYSQFVYKSSHGVVSDLLLNELRQLILATTMVSDAVSATLEVFESRVNPPDMLSVKIVAVCNEMGTVATVTLKPTVTVADAQKIVADMKAQIKGDFFSESVLYATIPCPKQIQVKGIPLPDPSVAEPAS